MTRRDETTTSVDAKPRTVTVNFAAHDAPIREHRVYAPCGLTYERAEILRDQLTLALREPTDILKMYDDAWAAVDPEVKRRAVKILQDNLDPGELEKVRDGYKLHGPHDWSSHEPFTVVVEYGDGMCFPDVWHFGGGMAVRNLLRSEGIKDEELPPLDAYYGEGTHVRNWDDYYVQAVEAAAGCRA